MSWLLPGVLFLPFPCLVLSQTGVIPVGCFPKAREWEASPRFLQLHNLSGCGCCGTGPRGSSLYLVTIPRGLQPRPSHLLCSSSSFLSLQSLDSSLPPGWLLGFSIPRVINPYIKALLFQILQWFLLPASMLTYILVSDLCTGL